MKQDIIMALRNALKHFSKSDKLECDKTESSKTTAHLGKT
jgi:hypothetical protein